MTSEPNAPNVCENCNVPIPAEAEFCNSCLDGYGDDEADDTDNACLHGVGFDQECEQCDEEAP